MGTGYSVLSATTDYCFILQHIITDVKNNLGYIPHDISQIHLQFNYSIILKGDTMKIKQAVAQRIVNLCKEKNIAINALGNISGINPSTIYSMLNDKSKNPGVVSLQKICDGLEISIREFFNDDLFDDIEQEIS